MTKSSKNDVKTAQKIHVQMVQECMAMMIKARSVQMIQIVKGMKMVQKMYGKDNNTEVCRCNSKVSRSK